MSVCITRSRVIYILEIRLALPRNTKFVCLKLRAWARSRSSAPPLYLSIWSLYNADRKLVWQRRGSCRTTWWGTTWQRNKRSNVSQHAILGAASTREVTPLNLLTEIVPPSVVGGLNDDENRLTTMRSLLSAAPIAPSVVLWGSSTLTS